MKKKILLFLASIITISGFAAQTTMTVRDGDGQPQTLLTGVDADGNQSIVGLSKDFLLAVQQGQIDGYSIMNDKFGENPAITTSSDPEDIWEGGSLYAFDADGTAPVVSLASNDESDTEDILITGLDINGDEVKQTITLVGTNRQALATALWRVYRMENEGALDLAGVVFCYTGTGEVPTIGDTEIRAIIDNGNNQTLMCIRTIPNGKVGFLYRGEVGLNWTGGAASSGDFARMYYKSRRFGGVFKIKKCISVMTSANSLYQDARSAPDIIPALTDIRLEVVEVSATMGVWGTFDILLVDEDKFSVAYLTAIGQPGY